MKNNIIPSALYKNFENIEYLATDVKDFVNLIQIDICDGEYVQAKSWPFNEIEKDKFQELGKSQFEDLYLPYWEEMDYVADMMVKSPESYIDTLISYGFSEVIIHFNSIENESREDTLLEIYKKLNFAEMGFSLAIDVHTNIDLFLEFIKLEHIQIKNIQIMGINKIGKQGEDFDDRTLDMILKVQKFLKENNLQINIMIDGGMNEESIYKCMQLGINIFVVGSALTRSENIKDEYNYLVNL